MLRRMLGRLVRRLLRRDISGISYRCGFWSEREKVLRALHVEGRVLELRVREHGDVPFAEDVSRPVAWLRDCAGPDIQVSDRSPNGLLMALACAVAKATAGQGDVGTVGRTPLVLRSAPPAAALASAPAPVAWQDMLGMFDPAVVTHPNQKPRSIPRDVAVVDDSQRLTMPVDPTFGVLTVSPMVNPFEELQRTSLVHVTVLCGEEPFRLPGVASGTSVVPLAAGPGRGRSEAMLPSDVTHVCQLVSAAVCTRVSAPDFAEVQTLAVCLSEHNSLPEVAAAVGTGLVMSGRTFRAVFVPAHSKSIQFRL